MPDLEPITREEMFLDGNTELTPITREEMILAGADLDVITRREWFLKKYRGSGGEIILENITITENGVVTAPSGKAYKKITTDVPLPDNAYLLKEVEGLPKDIATFNDGSALPMSNLKVSIEPIQSGSGDPSPSNVRPISGWTEAEVSVCGVNIWDEEWEVGAINDTTGQNKSSSATIRSKNYIMVKPSTTYFYCNLSNIFIAFYYYDENKEYIRSYDREDNRTFITPNNCYYIRFVINAGYGTTYNNDISINYPSTDTSYHAYNGHTTTIPFKDSQGNPIEVFGGECDVVNGGEQPNLYAIAELSADWAWNKSSTYQGSFYVDASAILGYKTYTPIMCSHAKTCERISDYVSGGCLCEDSINFWLMDENATVQDWKDYIASQKANGTPITIRFELATPSTFTSQPTSIKSQSGVNNVWGDCGQILEGEYFSKEA